MYVYIEKLSEYVGEIVEIKGWLYNKRSSGKIAFLELRDGTGFVQGVASLNDVGEDGWAQIEQSSQECSVEATGKVVEHPKKPGVYELQVQSFKVISDSVDYPIANKEHGPDFLMDNRHLWLRSSRQWAILRIRDAVIMSINEYLHKQDFIKVDSPIFTPNACEGTTTLFSVDYFDLGQAYLSQSGQLYLEAAVQSVGRCYDFGPVFRAEKSKTKRHLTEFWMMDAEAAFVKHDENLDIQQGLVQYIAKYCVEHCQKELEVLERDIKPLQIVAEKDFTRLTYVQAIEKLNELGSDIKYGEDLGNDDEGLLTKDSDVPVFIEKWPKSISPFYMKEDPENPDIVLNSDLIGIEGAGELIGGSEREDDYGLLLEKIKKDNLSLEDFKWYLDIRKYGSVPHSGFGIGLERTVRWIAGVEHIRECIPFPRTITRLRP